MNTQPSGDSNIWQRLAAGKRRWWLLGIPVGMLLVLGVGVVGALGSVAFVEYSSSEGFCISCHEMQANAYAEFKDSVHFHTASGVSPDCADCHVPGPIVPKLLRKIKATLVEVPSHILGTLDSPEKYEKHRLRLAKSVWEEMRKTDSRECRSCHRVERMDLSRQGRQAQRKHSPEWREKTGDTCIDCHQGVAHKLPEVDVADQP